MKTRILVAAVGLPLLLVVVLALRSVRRDAQRGCDGGCAGCLFAEGCAKRDRRAS